MEKPKVNQQEEERKKISPDSVDDQDDKKYKSQDIMEEVFGDDSDDLDIVAGENPDKPGSSEIIDEQLPDEGDKHQEEEQVQDDELESEEEEERQEEERKQEEKKGQEQPKIKFSEDAQKVLSSFNGDNSQKIEHLVKSYKQLQAKLSTYSNAQKVIDELGLSELSQDKAVGVMKDIKSAYYDFLQNPLVLDVLDNLAKGKIPEGISNEKKTVQDFMTEEDIFSWEDATSDTNSTSWKAREQWEEHNATNRNNKQKLISSIGSYKEKSNGNVTSLDELKKKMNDKMITVKSFAVEEFDGVSDTVFNDFVGDFKELSIDAIKIHFAMFAKKNGIVSKKSAKLTKNKNKQFAEGMIEDPIEPKGKTVKSGVTVDEDKDYSGAFKDWDADDNTWY